jgi:hypothetical protein
MYMALANFNGWFNVFLTVVFAVLGGVFMYLARPSVQQPTSWTKTYKGVGIFFFVLAAINFVLVIMHAGAAYYTPENAPAQMDAVIPGNPIVRNNNNGKNTYYNASTNFPPTRANALMAEAAPGPTRANALKNQAARIPETPV